MYIPLVTLVGFINGVLAISIALLLSRRHAQTSQADPGARRFIFLFTSIGVVWSLYTFADFLSTVMPGVVWFNMAADIFVYVGSVAAVRAACYAINNERLSRRLAAAIVVAGVIFTIGRLWYHLPYAPVIYGQYIYWRPMDPVWLTLLTGLVSSSSLLFFSFIFLTLGFKTRHNPVVLRRSLALGGGMLCVLMSTILFFVVAAPGPWETLISVVFSSLGLIVMYAGLTKTGSIADQPPDKII